MKYRRNTNANQSNSETLGRWAVRIGISYRTAWRWHRKDHLPAGVTSEQMPTGTIMVTDSRPSGGLVTAREATIYARVNPREEPHTLQEQIDICKRLCTARGWTVSRVVKERAPGVGSQRPKLARIVEERPPLLVVASKSVLSRFDYVFYAALWKNLGVELVVVDESSEQGGQRGALADLTDAINLTCHRHYGPKRGMALIEMLDKVVSGEVQV